MSASKRRAVSAIYSALAAGPLRPPPPKHAETCCQIARDFRNVPVHTLLRTKCEPIAN